MRGLLAFAIIVFLTGPIAAQPAEDFDAISTTELIQIAPTRRRRAMWRARSGSGHWI